MNRTNKKGFTLVELLVVIAILAILATVSVVGYTAFIERASVSNDENVAAQLNQFLTAMKADSTGDYYEELNTKGITPKNVWKIIDAVLAENGTLTDLDPQSKDYGYHYFFKFDKNEAGEYKDGEIIVAKEGDVILGLKKGYLAAHAAGTATDDYGVGFFTAKDEDNNDILYFFLDTKGSDLATAVNAFQQLSGWNRIDGENNTEKLKNIIEAVKNVKTECGDKADYTDKLNGTRFATSEGQLATNEDANKNIIVVEENANVGGNVTVVTVTTNESGTTTNTSSATAKPLDPDTNTITIPAGVKLTEGSLNVDPSKADTVTIIVETDSLETISTTDTKNGTVEAGFTNSTKVEIKVDNDNNSYTVEVKTETDGTKTTVIVKVESEGNTTETGHQLGTGLFPMKSFEIIANDITKKTDIRTNGTAYVAIDAEDGFTFDIMNIKGVGNDPVSKGSVRYEIVGMKVDGNSVTDFSTYAEISGNKLTLKKDGEYFHKIDEIEIKATAEKPYEGDNYANDTYTVYVVRPTNVKGLTLGGESLNSGSVSLGNSESTDGQTKTNTVFTFSTSSKTIEYNHTGYDTSKLEFDTTTTLVQDNENFNYTADTIQLKATDKFAITDAKITVKVGDFFEKDYNVTLYDQCQLSKLSNKSQIRYLGDEGAALDLSVLYKDNVALPEGAQLYVFSKFGTTPKYPCKSTGWTEYDPDYYTITNTSIIFKNITSEIKLCLAWAIRTGTAPNLEYEIVSDVVEIRAVHALNLLDGQNPVINTTTGETVFKQDPFTGVASGHDHDKDTCSDSAKGAHVTTEKNLVLLDNYHLTDRQYLTLKNSTLYGNLFTLDVTNGRNNSTGIIELVGSTMKDTMVKAKEYKTTNDPWWKKSALSSNKNHIYDREYSAAAVRVYGSASTISNCYISGARSALRVESSGTALNDVVLFGGAYANLNIENAITVNLKNVVTVNQYKYFVNDSWTTLDGMFGCGIIVANATTTAKLNISGDNGLMQFNFIGCSDDEISHVYDEGRLFDVTIKDIVAGRNTTYKNFLKDFKYSYDNTDYFSINILESKADAKDSGGNNVNITIGTTQNLPAYNSKNSYNTMTNGYIIGISFDNTKTSGKESDFASTQYGFEFSVEKFLKEASKYHPDNIGKTSSAWSGSYEWKYRD